MISLNKVNDKHFEMENEYINQVKVRDKQFVKENK